MTFALLASGCAGLKEARQEREDIQIEADEAEESLAQLKPKDALLAIARARDARRDSDQLHLLALHAKPGVRIAALRAAALVGDPSSLGPLLAALGDRDPTVRAAAAWSLSQVWSWPLTALEGQTSMGRAEEALLAALEDEEELVATLAFVRALGEVGSDVSEEELWTLVVRPALRDEVLLALAIRGKRGATPPLGAQQVAVLKAVAGDGPLPFAAAYLLARAGVEETSGANAAKWLQETEPADPAAVSWRLRAIGKVAPAGHPALLLLDWHLRGGDTNARVSALRGAAQRGVEVRALLQFGLQDEEPLIAAEAARALGALADAEACDALLAWAPTAPRARAGRLDGLTALVSKSEDAELIDRARAAGAAALADENPHVRASAYGLVAAWKAPEAVAPLLGAVPTEADPGALLGLALAIAGRSDGEVEGQLLIWLDGDDTLLGAVGAMGLAEREGAHIVERLTAAYTARTLDPTEAERRLEIARALAAREDVGPDVITQLLQDAEPGVRVAVWSALAKRVGRAESGSAPQQREFPDLPDASFGVGDVTGAVITTSRGDLTFDLFPDTAPGAVASFVKLAEDGYFDDLIFHRVVLDFVIQGGDPMGTGWGGPGYTLREEFSARPFDRGTLGMARSDKDTAGSQWFVCHSRQPHLDGHYTVFGQQTDGFEVLDAVRPDDVIQSVTIRR
ncbi:MAG: peptidylprolyl isomerase [Proteobacteria bacterium]|nr:peptidylprolyl isomerase [Pseudomonadota bacterium]